MLNISALWAPLNLFLFLNLHQILNSQLSVCSLWYKTRWWVRHSLVAQMVKNLPAMQETQVWFPGQEDLLEKEMTTPSSILAWGILWTEEPGRVQSMGLQRLRRSWVTDAHNEWGQNPENPGLVWWIHMEWAECGRKGSKSNSHDELGDLGEGRKGYRLFKDIEYSTQCYTVDPCCSSILHSVVYTC